ncbi:MAG: hypothetical protein AAFX40_17575, partial [Cyanobacteria bacterium J06639_1]
MRWASKRYRIGGVAIAVAIAAACGSNSSSVTSVQPVETSASGVSSTASAGAERRRDATSLIYEGSATEVSVGDAALVHAWGNLPAGTSVDDLVEAANRLMRLPAGSSSRIQTPLNTTPTASNVDWAEPDGRITVQDVAVVVASQLRQASDRTVAGVEADAQRLMGGTTVRLKDSVPGSSDARAGGPAQLVKNDGFDQNTVDTLKNQLDVDRLSSVAQGGNVFLTPGVEFLLPSSASPNRRVLRIAANPPLSGSRNEPPVEFTAGELGCDGRSCKVPDFKVEVPEDSDDLDEIDLSPVNDIVDIVPLGFKAEEGDYTLTYEFSPDGFDSADRRSLVFERVLTVTPAEDIPFANDNRTQAALRDEISEIANELNLPISPPPPGEEITSADVAWLPILDLPDSQIENLEGIEKLDLLQAVDVSDNSIQDLPPSDELDD